MISVAFCGPPFGTLGAIQSHFGYHGFHFMALGQPCWAKGNPQKATFAKLLKVCLKLLKIINQSVQNY